MCPGEKSSLQAGPGEIGSLEMRFVQRDILQVSPDELSLLQVGLAQVGSREQDCCGSALLCRSLIPLFAGEATAQTRQRKGMQVRTSQIRTPQVQPLGLLLPV